MPYSATYDDGTGNTATINYTLDNYMSVSAQIGDVYYTKTGYLIKNGIIFSLISLNLLTINLKAPLFW